MVESSGWIIDNITNVNLNIARYNPFRGSSHIPTPARLFNKKAIVNVDNDDQKLFCILCWHLSIQIIITQAVSIATRNI